MLGAVLLNNDNFHLIAGMMKEEYFFDPVHAYIWTNIAGRISKGHLASPVTLKTDMENHPGLKLLGGAPYLARLVHQAISASFIKDYAQSMVKDYRKRCLHETFTQAADQIEIGEDLGAITSAVEMKLAEIPSEDGSETSIHLLGAFVKAIKGMAKGYEEGISQGLLTGLKEIDDLTGGLHSPDFIILAGRPSMGKTALATSLALRVAKQDIPVAVVSLEMSDEGLAHRILSELSGVPYFVYRKAHKMNQSDFQKTVQAAKEWENLPIEIVPPHVREIGGIYSALKTIAKRHANGLGLVIVDYLQLASGPGKGDTERVSELSRQFKHLTRLLNCPIIALAQLSRNVESRDNKRPVLSDLRDSGQIEQDADMVMFAYRDFYYLDRQDPPKKVADQADYEAAKSACKNVMEVIIGKQRMGPIGTARIGCAVATNRFWNIGEDQTDLGF